MTIAIQHVFPAFSKRHASFEKYGEISTEAIELFKERAAPDLFSQALVDFWQEYGEGRFSNGLLFVCDPIRKKSVMEFFFPKKDLYPFAISSFGVIYFTDFKFIYALRSIYGWFEVIKTDFEMLFEGRLQRESTLDDTLFKPFHDECVQKIGKLGRDEIFGFEPAIALGGNDENIKSVKKFQMDAHFAFLSQLVELEER